MATFTESIGVFVDGILIRREREHTTIGIDYGTEEPRTVWPAAEYAAEPPPRREPEWVKLGRKGRRW
jgi:hypothetical protein